VPNLCTWQAPTVTLRDGRQVRSDSVEWLKECKERHELASLILSWPIEKRRVYLFDQKTGFGQRYGQEQLERLQAEIKRQFSRQKK
jgi:hypothetical protein